MHTFGRSGVVGTCASLMLLLTPVGAAATAPLVLAKDGAATALILTPAQPSPLESYAAGQLVKALKRMAGGAFRSASEAVPAPPSYDQAVISIGKTALSAGLTMQGPAWQRQNPEAFRIVRQGNALVICGNPQGATPDFGTLWGVYAFLEMQGVGSYMQGQPLGEIFPARPDIVIEDLDVTDAPWFEMRGGDDTVANYLKRAGEQPGDLLAFSRAAASERMEFYHSFQYIATAQVRKEHPEWFAGTHNSPYGAQPGADPPLGWGLADNGICLCRLEIRALFIEFFRKRFRENPDLRVATLCPDDYTLGYRCECPECTRLINLGDPLPPAWRQNTPPDLPPQRSATDLLVDFVNAVAAGLHDEFPDRRLITYAYLDYIGPPTTVRVHPNIVVMPVGYWENSTPEMDKVVRGWQATGAGKLYWYGWLLTRPPVPHLMREWYRNFKRAGIRGAYLEFTNVPTSNLVNHWLYGKLSWNPDADVGRLLDDYFFGLFGPEVGLQMRRFFAAAWEVNPPVNESIPGLLAAAAALAGDPESPVSKRVRFFTLSWDLYSSSYNLDAALKAADIPEAQRIVSAGIATAEALQREYPWSIQSNVWLHNTSHMAYAVTVLPALNALLNTALQKPLPEAPFPGPAVCLTGNADLPTQERVDRGISVSFDQPPTGGRDGALLFDGHLDGPERNLSPGDYPGWTITLDLQKPYQIERVEVCTGKTSGRWDVVPIYVEVQLSQDGNAFVPVDRILPRTLKGWAQSGTLYATARQVRLLLTSLNMWHAVSEVRVWGRPVP